MRFPCVRLLVACSVGFCLQAGGWAPIPQEVWDMKEDRASGVIGAVVLEERVHFRPKYLEYVRRVRILSEAGKDAVEYPSFPAEAQDFDGRTVYRDGRVVAFQNRKDFQEKAVLSSAGEELKRVRLIPPGLSGDCVVELRWKEPVDPEWGPLPKSYGYMHWWRLGGAHKTLLSVLELPARLYWAQMVQYYREVPQIEDKGESKIYTFRNLPAMGVPPYSTEFSREVPRFTLYAPLTRLAEYDHKPHAEYWKAALELIYKPYFEKGIRKSTAYRRLLAEISSGLPEEPRSRAIEVCTRLNQQIRNAGELTKSEEGLVERGERLSGVSDLEAACQSGYASRSGMRLLYYHLLKDLGFQPRLALVADPDRWQFRFALHNIFQFTDELIGVGDDPVKALWIDPTARFTEPGLVHPDYQGSWALAVDTRDWSGSSFQIPVQSHDANRASFEYRLTLDEDEDRFSLEAGFSGFLAQRERNRYALLEPKEQDRLLKERFESALKGAELSRVQVLNAAAPRAQLRMQVEGAMEPEGERRRVVRPFPGMDQPIWIPDVFPDQRRIPIQIPYRRTWEATSRFAVPRGYRFEGSPAMDLSNVFGQVHWSAVTAERDGKEEVTVTFRVTVTAHSASAGQYAYFRTFLSWVDQAHRRTLTLERTS